MGSVGVNSAYSVEKTRMEMKKRSHHLSSLNLCQHLYFLLNNGLLSTSAPLVANPCRSVTIAHKMASEEHTPSYASL